MALLSVPEFSGLRTAANPGKLEDSELQVCVNFDPTDRKYLAKRTGIAKYTTNPSPFGVAAAGHRILGRHKTSTHDHLWVGNNNAADGWWVNLSTGLVNYVSTLGWVHHHLMYGGYSWLFTDSGLRRWDGTTLTTVASLPAGHMGVVYRDRMFIANIYNTDSQVNFSEVYGNPGVDFNGTASWPAANYDRFDPGDGDRVVAIWVLNDILMVFKSTKIFAYYTQSADVTQWSFKILNRSLGCISYRTLVEIEGLLYFEARDGVYRTDGITFEEISVPIRDKFRARSGAVGDLWQSDGAVRWGNKYILFRNDTIAGTHQVLVYDYVNQAWTEYQFKSGAIKPTWALATPDLSPWQLFLNNSATNGNYLYRMGDPTLFTDDGDSYPATMRTKSWDFGESGKMKKALEASLELKTTTGTPTFSWQHEDNTSPGSSSLLLPVSSGENSYIAPVQGPGYFRRIAFELSNNGAVPFEILGFHLNLIEKRTAYNRQRT